MAPVLPGLQILHSTYQTEACENDHKTLEGLGYSAATNVNQTATLWY